jgi:hypothetical protein
MIMRNLGRESVVVNAVATLTAATIQAISSKVRYATVQVLDADVAVTFEGTAPVGSGATGEVWYSTKTYRIWGIDTLLATKFIKNASTNARLEVNYWGSAN